MNVTVTALLFVMSEDAWRTLMVSVVTPSDKHDFIIIEIRDYVVCFENKSAVLLWPAAAPAQA